MSAETQAAMDAAIEAHVRDEWGDTDRIVTGYAGMVSSVSLEDVDRGVTAYSTIYPVNQAAHIGDGLALRLMRELEYSQRDQRD